METQNLGNTSLLSSMKQNLGLLLGAVAILLFMIFGVWWLLRPTYEVLVQDLPQEARAEVLATLMQQQVPYEVEEGTGNVMVPSEQVATLRAQLSDQGLPSKQAVGLELFGQGDYGMSEFAQRINYQRALEGELARTVQSIEEVRHARVHITLGKSSIFENRKEPAKASVVLQLKPERHLTGQQVFGIQQLIAAAVPALTADQVVVLDDMGRSLTSADGMAGGDRWSSIRQVEQDYEARLRSLLVGAVPDTDFQLSVKLQVNFDKVKSIREEVLPAKGQQSGYLVKKREQVSSGPSGSDPSATVSRSNNNAETEYLFGRERAEIERAVGNVERINVAVIASRPLSPQVTDTLRAVIQSGLGMVADRGDSLAIVGAVSPGIAKTELPLIDQKMASDTSLAHSASQQNDLSSKAIYIGAVVMALLLLALTMFHRKRNSSPSQPRQLSQEERERLLQQVRLWLTHEPTR